MPHIFWELASVYIEWLPLVTVWAYTLRALKTLVVVTLKGVEE